VELNKTCLRAGDLIRGGENYKVVVRIVWNECQTLISTVYFSGLHSLWCITACWLF